MLQKEAPGFIILFSAVSFVLPFGELLPDVCRSLKANPLSAVGLLQQQVCAEQRAAASLRAPAPRYRQSSSLSRLLDHDTALLERFIYKTPDSPLPPSSQNP